MVVSFGGNGGKSQREMATTEMGTLLLKGWVMSDKACETCFEVPLMCDKQRKVWKCTFCELQENTDKDNSNEICAKPLATADADTFQDNTFSPGADEKFSSPSVSSLLGDKMIQGWTLMGQNCSFCRGVPLMKQSKESLSLICVACDRTFMNEKDYEKNPSKVTLAPSSDTERGSKAHNSVKIENFSSSSTPSTSPTSSNIFFSKCREICFSEVEKLKVSLDTCKSINEKQSIISSMDMLIDIMIKIENKP